MNNTINTTTKLKTGLPDPFAKVKEAASWTIGLFTGSDIGVLLTIFGAFIIIGIGTSISFEVILPNVRTQFANNIVAVIGALIFMYIIFQFSDKKGSIMGTPIDISLILYILIIGGVVLAFSG
jgi:hypothetical protein